MSSVFLDVISTSCSFLNRYLPVWISPKPIWIKTTLFICAPLDIINSPIHTVLAEFPNKPDRNLVIIAFPVGVERT